MMTFIASMVVVLLVEAFVVAGENPGSKLAKAEQFGIPVLTEAEFLKKVR